MAQQVKKLESSSQSLSDELLEALEEAHGIKKLGDHRDQFLSNVGAVADDNHKTKAVFIYWAYLKWISNKGIKPIHRKSFYRGFHKLFKQKSKRFNFYYVKSPAFVISKEEKKQMLAHLKAENEYYKWQREKRRNLKKLRQRRRLKQKQRSLDVEIEALIQGSKKVNSPK